METIPKSEDRGKLYSQVDQCKWPPKGSKDMQVQTKFMTCNGKKQLIHVQCETTHMQTKQEASLAEACQLLVSKKLAERPDGN